MPRARISVSNLALKWGQSISMGEVLYSSKWVKYSALPWATTQNTTTTHSDQHEPPPPYPSVAFALSLRGNIHNGPKFWRRWSLWAHTRRAALGALLLLFVPLFGAPKRNTSKIRKRDVTLALGGCLLVGQHKNQPKVGVCGRKDIGEGAQPGRSMWGGCCTIVWGGKLSDKK